MSNTPLVIERILDAPVTAVWEAITDKDKMKQWYFDLSAFSPTVGFEFSFSGGSETKQYLHHCKITEVIPGKKLSYTWRYEGYPGNSEVTWELAEEGKKTKLTLTHTGLHTFPSGEDSNFGVASFTQGWTYIIGTSLPEYLAKQAVAQ
ncbi:SRPBCC domain-containing protein [Chitinophaga polysaccharea]|uniref:SRPBCC family protein n=1 Tax=Chitinophaga polysaccharea TaxID=1293035 RepID=UPI0014550E78|nr:SRPBCC domain-containing protein [Chitinophaga polysaccharea]NLR57882.1 SRPBCC domain-containing protein [Chitinophaga polysaccharea]